MNLIEQNMKIIMQLFDNNYGKCVSILQLNDGYYTLDNGETYLSCNVKFGSCKFCTS